MGNMERIEEISLLTIFRILKKNIVWILLGAVLLGCGAAVLGEFAIEDVYTSSITCMIGDGSTSNTDLGAMDHWTARYKTILTSKSAVKRVVENSNIDDSNLSFAVSEMMGATSFSANDSGVFTISVTYKNAATAYAMITGYKDTMSELIAESHLPFELTLVDSSTAPAKAPSNGGRMLKYGAIGFVLGAVLVFGVALLITLSDKKIRTEQELKELLGLPVVGIIPNISVTESTNDTTLKLEN